MVGHHQMLWHIDSKHPLDKAIQKSVANVAKGFQGDVSPDTRGVENEAGEAGQFRQTSGVMNKRDRVGIVGRHGFK